MDPNRFDGFSRMLATRLSRRNAMRGLGASGITAAVFVPASATRVEAQDEDPDICVLNFIAYIRSGPSANVSIGGNDPSQIQGQMRFSISSTDRMSDGSIELLDGTVVELLGVTDAQSFAGRVEGLDAGPLVLFGVGERSIRACSGAIDGVFNGPALGDHGDWHTVDAGSGGIATQTPAVASQTCNLTCPSDQILDTQTCACLCFAGSIACNGSCVDPSADNSNCGGCGLVCGSGSTCQSGECSCDEATWINCDGSCFDPSTDTGNCGGCDLPCPPPHVCVAGVCECPAVDCTAIGALNLATCECECLPEGSGCAAGEICCSASCDFLVGGGTCAPCLGRSCTSTNSCCGGLQCNGGFCGGCRDRGSACTSSDQCCYSRCESGACLSLTGGPCARNADCRSCYLGGPCEGACAGGTCTA